MNERIKELLDKACEYAHSKHFAHVKKFKYVTPDQHANAQDTMQEKFVELIVKECVDVALEQKKWVEDQEVFNPQDEQWNRARIQQSQHIADKIREHFGETK